MNSQWFSTVLHDLELGTESTVQRHTHSSRRISRMRQRKPSAIERKGVKVHTCTVVVKESSPSVEFSYHASVDHVEDDKQVIYKWRFIEAHSMLVSVLHSRHS